MTRNPFEASVAKALGLEDAYETDKIPYSTPHTYTPDFVAKDILGHKFYIETKGRFPEDDRRKMRRVILCNPGIRILMILQNPHQKEKGLKRTAAQHCEAMGLPWCTPSVAKEFVQDWQQGRYRSLNYKTYQQSKS